MRYRALDGQKHFGKGGEMWCGYAALSAQKSLNNVATIAKVRQLTLR
jgi:hypothetical protein